MKTKNPVPSPVAMASLPVQVAGPGKTIAQTVATHQSDPQHHFHARGKAMDGRVKVADGERLQRVRARAQAN